MPSKIAKQPDLVGLILLKCPPDCQTHVHSTEIRPDVSPAYASDREKNYINESILNQPQHREFGNGPFKE